MSAVRSITRASLLLVSFEKRHLARIQPLCYIFISCDTQAENVSFRAKWKTFVRLLIIGQWVMPHKRRVCAIEAPFVWCDK